MTFADGFVSLSGVNLNVTLSLSFCNNFQFPLRREKSAKRNIILIRLIYEQESFTYCIYVVGVY